MAKEPEEPEEGEDEETGDGGIRIGDHPRARRSIARARAWAAVVGFFVAAWFSHRAGLSFVPVVIRSILIGCAAYLAVWAGAQAVWKQIIFAEIAVRRKEAAEAQKDLLEAIQGEQGDGPGGATRP